MDRQEAELVADAARRAIAAFDVRVALDRADAFGGWAVTFEPAGEGCASLELLLPDGAGDECV